MALIPLNQQFHTQSGDIDTSNKGSKLANSGRSSFTMQDIVDTVGGVDSKSSVFVKADGTPQENGAALLAAYADAAAKSLNTLGVYAATGGASFHLGGGDYIVFGPIDNLPSTVILNKNYTATFGTTPAQTLVWRATSLESTTARFLITDTQGVPQTSLTLDTSQLPVYGGDAIKSTLIIGPGRYELPSDLVVEDLVSITSLTGENDVFIYGANVIIKGVANFPGVNFSNFQVGDQESNPSNGKFFIEDGLTDTIFKNIISPHFHSFNNEAGGGNMSGTFIDCIGGSFGGYVGGHASGTFINCKGQGSSFGAGGGAITSGYFEGCTIDPDSTNSTAAAYGSFSTQCGGTFVNCTSLRSSFGNNCDDVIAYFENCRSYGFNSFGSQSDKNSGTFINCHALPDIENNISGGNFGSKHTTTVAADTEDSKYYYCTATGGENFGSFYGDASKTAYGTYIGCISEGAFEKSFGEEVKGNLFNCVVQDGTYATVGTGKIRNSIDGSFNIITLN
jgi:hypothetical protein